MQLVYFEPGKTGAIITILSLSLSAVTFPALSRKVPFIRIPRVIFFIGKHFGTGVILSTAFCHLLEDAFKSLDKPPVKEHYGKIGKWTGLIILSSLLAIFLVEYASSTYVDYLQADRSTPPTPIETPRRSRSVSISKWGRQAGPCVPLEEDLPHPSEELLLVRDLDIGTNNNSKASSRRQSRHRGEASAIPIGLITNSRHRVKCCLLPETCVCSQREAMFIDDGSVVRLKEEKEQKSITRNRRQIVGILVLQLGIMIHSLVIGLTLSITQGSDFASLLVAICFHQVFEGLSLGIRIDGLPPASALFPSPPPSESTPLQRPSQSYASIRHHQEPDVSRPHLLRPNWLKTVLSVLFAITTPFGMIAGLYAFPHGDGASKPRGTFRPAPCTLSAC
ncbi:hypothetical protein AX14_000320 [Amanita brunnescens Koide BX004]|nr:hypothetical protein AX14_000320 [Amanita brunnescens Koide BX004]